MAAAEIIVPIVLEAVGHCNSVVDVGGGTGAWLSVFLRHGVGKVALFEVQEVSAQLLIDPAYYQPVDLNQTMPSLSRQRFDLALCLECAEHLHPSRSTPLVATLTSCTDVVLFSAAIPGQPGNGHINLQFPSYWRQLFANHGFIRHDVIRPLIITRQDIPYWYRQNLYVFSRPSFSLNFRQESHISEDFELLYGPNIGNLRPLGFRNYVSELGPAFARAVKRRTNQWRKAVKNNT